jgi:hypothetical protein
MSLRFLIKNQGFKLTRGDKVAKEVVGDKVAEESQPFKQSGKSADNPSWARCNSLRTRASGRKS